MAMRVIVTRDFVFRTSTAGSLSFHLSLVVLNEANLDGAGTDCSEINGVNRTASEDWRDWERRLRSAFISLLRV
jgi:hypothetical protein